MILETDYLKGRDQLDPLNVEMQYNMKHLLKQLNLLFQNYYSGAYYGISSGYRPAAVNAAAGGAKKSAHLTCEACDLRDPGNKLGKWLIERPDVLVALDLYLEEPTATPGWCHLQSRRTGSGRRIFKP